MLYMHEVKEGFVNPKLGTGFGGFNPNRYSPSEVGQYGWVFVGTPENHFGLDIKKYFVSTESHVNVWRDGNWQAGCKTLGRVTKTMIQGFGTVGRSTHTCASASIFISPEAWEQLRSGEMERLLPRHLRERNAGHASLAHVLSHSTIQVWMEKGFETSEAFELESGTKLLKLGYSNFQFKASEWVWDGKDTPCTSNHLAVAIDQKGYLWCHLPEDGGFEGSFEDSTWVREDDQEFWVKTVGRGPAEM